MFALLSFVLATIQSAKKIFPLLFFACHVPFVRNEYRLLQISFNPNIYILHKVNISQKLYKKLKKKKIINAYRPQSLIRNYVLFKLLQDTNFLNLINLRHIFSIPYPLNRWLIQFHNNYKTILIEKEKKKILLKSKHICTFFNT